ncbi:MAG: hypothetical protein ACYDGR_01885 [Candidatus Dormibacteria bacterium]
MGSRAAGFVARAALAGLGLVVVVAFFAAAPTPARGGLRLAISRVGGVAAPLLIALLLVTAAAVAWAAWRSRSHPDLIAEEPLLRPPNLPSVTRNSPVIALIGMEPKSGSSTLAFNLAAQVTAGGTVRPKGGPRRARPVCVLAEGGLSESLGLSSEPLAVYVADHPGHLREDVLDLIVSHLAGFDVLCVGPGQLDYTHLVRLLEMLRKEYDAIVFDGAFGDDRLADNLAGQCDSLLVCALASPNSAAAAANWALRSWDRHQERRTAVVVNRIRATSRIPNDLTTGFLYGTDLPDDPNVKAQDGLGKPWALVFESQARLRLAKIAEALLPELFREEGVGEAA